MSRFVLALCILLAVSYATGKCRCPKGEIWSNCGSACPPTCEDPNPICTLQCVPRCVCPRGQLRDSNGKCVPPNQCPY